MRVFLVTLLSLSLVYGLPLPAAKAASPEAAYGKNGMVASRSTLASQAGIEVMQAGGNAVDAAVATAFALAVTYPSAGNIGGGGFAVVRLADGKVVTLDHREMAPGAAHRDMFLDDDGEVIKGLSTRSHLAAGVPGSVDGLLTLLAAHGNLSRQAVMAPAIKLASKGFPLTYDLARQFKRQLKYMRTHPTAMEKFSRAGEAYAEGDIWVQKDLADTLKRISREGRDGFYRGKTARRIVAEMQRGGGIISAEDLANYRSQWREPVHGTYKGYEIWGMAAPSSGGLLIQQILNMLEPYDPGALGWGSAAAVHLLVEAERRAYADRAEYLGDPDFHEVPAAMLIDKDYARQRFADFDPEQASDSELIGAGEWHPEGEDTTHFSVMDAQGMMVAFTTTLNSSYGSKIVVAGTGILLNNEMDDFAIKLNTPNQFGLIGREANAVAPGKRMLSSMSPTLVTHNNQPLLSTGSPGGSTIITTTLQVILNVIEHQMSIEDAVSLPRFHHQWKPDVILYDRYALSPDTLHLLHEMGHQTALQKRYSRGIGDANSILFKDGLMHGIKDPRGDGIAVGY